MHCDHANEVPVSCPCTPTCYCKSHTCRTVQDHAVQLEEYGGGKSKLWHRWMCSCGSAGEWKDKQSQAKIGGTKHVATIGKKR